MEIGSLIDAEYDVLEDYTKEELRTYLVEFGFDKEEVERYLIEDAPYTFPNIEPEN